MLEIWRRRVPTRARMARRGGLGSYGSRARTYALHAREGRVWSSICSGLRVFICQEDHACRGEWARRCTLRCVEQMPMI